MKSVWIVSFIFFGMLTITPVAQANQNHQQSKFDRQLNVAHKHPNQLNAAISWRINNTAVNLSRSVRAISKFGWHPSVIAVISSPHFGNYVQNDYRTRQFRQNSQYNRNNNGFRTQTRNGRKQNNNRVRNQIRKY